LAFFFVGFFFFEANAAPPALRHKHNDAAKKNHSHTFMKDPDEPEAWEPELSALEPDFKEDPAFSESDTNESDEVPLEPEEESQGVNVVVRTVGAAAAVPCTIIARMIFIMVINQTPML